MRLPARETIAPEAERCGGVGVTVNSRAFCPIPEVKRVLTFF